ncbi:hypothetical protein KY290_020981 [Solanum tuberosum]|uniref:Uncharacterized protein n=1 Tax=Solanum tuberosum TaxID=4113 RepID=A0ABQ7V079_SOLTU|nr:hypothetical protein KY289_020167 [Solanum tuberosum]KAH0692829.1 hypothetical protein KY285_019926 [Solanum tuberosum]KAH0757488.1 hypothetical protein KY290_020981 [Solanum tuberosum]
MINAAIEVVLFPMWAKVVSHQARLASYRERLDNSLLKLRSVRRMRVPLPEIATTLPPTNFRGIGLSRAVEQPVVGESEHMGDKDNDGLATELIRMSL